MGLFIKLREASRLQREARIAAAEKAGNPGSDYVDEAQVFYEELDYAKYPKCVVPFVTWGLGPVSCQPGYPNGCVALDVGLLLRCVNKHKRQTHILHTCAPPAGGWRCYLLPP